MKVHDMLSAEHEINIIIEQCSQFIEESNRTPIFRALPVEYNNIHKVKVRKKNIRNLDYIFNEAFDEHHPHMRQRAIFTYPQLTECVSGTEPFFVFPIDGFKFMYSSEVMNSSEDYNQVLKSVVESLGTVGSEVITDMLKFNYTHENLTEGIASGAEIVIYNTPHYYAVRVNEENTTLLTDMQIL